MSETGKPRSPLAGPPGPTSEPDRQLPPDTGVRPLAVDARRVVLTGTALFGLTFVVLLPFWTWLGEHQHRVWLWTALAGAVLGLLALPLVRKHTGEGRLG